MFEHYAGDGDLIVGDRAFSDCKELTSIKLGDTEMIGNYAFYGCVALESVWFDDSIKIIGDNAFKGCESLSNITLGGTSEEWRKMTSHLGQASDNGKITVRCSNGEMKFDLY